MKLGKEKSDREIETYDGCTYIEKEKYARESRREKDRNSETEGEKVCAWNLSTLINDYKNKS